MQDIIPTNDSKASTKGYKFENQEQHSNAQVYGLNQIPLPKRQYQK